MIYDKFYELNRQIQLQTELKIAEIKTSNGFNINDDESILPVDIINEIQIVQNRSEELIKLSENYQKKLNQKLLNEEIKYSKADEASKKQNSLILDELNIEFKLSMSKYDDLLGNLIHKKDIKTYRISLIDICEIVTSDFPGINHDEGFTKSKSQLGILGNGNYFFSFKVCYSSSFLLIYNPRKTRVKKTLKIDGNNKAVSINVTKNKIAVLLSEENNAAEKTLEAYDKNLNKISKSIKMTGDLSLIGADQSNIFLSQNEEIISYNWSLEKMKSKFKFQFKDTDKPFYLPNETNLGIKIFQFEQLKDFNVFRLNLKHETNQSLRKAFVIIYDNNGKTIKRIKATGRFHINLSMNQMIVTYGPDLLKYYDLNGNLLKEESLLLPDSNRKTDNYSIVCDSKNNILIFKKS